jgi:hypothetical protein
MDDSTSFVELKGKYHYKSPTHHPVDTSDYHPNDESSVSKIKFNSLGSAQLLQQQQQPTGVFKMGGSGKLSKPKIKLTSHESLSTAASAKDDNNNNSIHISNNNNNHHSFSGGIVNKLTDGLLHHHHHNNNHQNNSHYHDATSAILTTPNSTGAYNDNNTINNSNYSHCSSLDGKNASHRTRSSNWTKFKSR